MHSVAQAEQKASVPYHHKQYIPEVTVRLPANALLAWADI